MKQDLSAFPFRSVLSLRPLIDFWLQTMAPASPAKACLLDGIRDGLEAAPELREPIQDLNILDRHREVVQSLMSVVFPPAFWEVEPYAAVIPFRMEPVWVSPSFRHLFLNQDGALSGRMNLDDKSFMRGRFIRAYLRILDEFYGIHQYFEYPVIRIVKDSDTGLDRHFRMKLNLRFVEVKAVNEPKPLTEKERARVMEHLTDPELLAEIIPPENFEFQGFSVLQAVDVTESEVLSMLERDLIDQESFLSQTGFHRLQQRLQTLFRRPDLVASLAAFQEDQVLLLNTGCEMCGNCLFSDSRHLPMTDFEGSAYQRAVKGGNILRIPDLQQESHRTRVEEEILRGGTRSMLIAPLHYQGQILGTLDLGSPRPEDLGPVDALFMGQILPLFSMALKRALDEFEHNVQAVIKEKCTAVHPTVEWRFRKAAFHYLDARRRGEPGEMEPIVFRDVYPLYGISDVRGSSEERTRAVQGDLEEHLKFALDVVRSAADAKPQPILEELAYRIDKALERIRAGLASGDEVSLAGSLRREVEPLFSHLRGFDPRVAKAIEAYEAVMDPHMGTVYQRRREFEESVFVLTDRISAYLDKEEAEAQAIFPHYFEKHRTDGVDYLLYIGDSLLGHGSFNALYLENLRLWQFMVTCGIAWLTESLKPTLKVPLDTAHLVLVHHSPMSIRFRFDEKRFDVDGTYDVRHEILKARIDKALVKGTGERLTQPGRIAIVYSHLEEARESRRHIDFLQAQGYLSSDLESLELEDLPGIQGLRALRVGIDLESRVLAQRAERMAG